MKKEKTMATENKKQKPPKQEANEPNPIIDGTRKVILASIGAVAYAQDELETLINKLIERGEIAEKDGKKLISEIKDKRKKGTKQAQEELNKQIEEMLKKMNVPTKSEVDELNKKISELSKKIDALNNPK